MGQAGSGSDRTCTARVGSGWIFWAWSKLYYQPHPTSLTALSNIATIALAWQLLSYCTVSKLTDPNVIKPFHRSKVIIMPNQVCIGSMPNHDYFWKSHWNLYTPCSEQFCPAVEKQLFVLLRDDKSVVGYLAVSLHSESSPSRRQISSSSVKRSCGMCSSSSSSVPSRNWTLWEGVSATQRENLSYTL